MKTFIKEYPVWSFLIINYIISWSFLYPSYQIILKNDGITPLALIGLIGAYGPTIAAIIVQYIIDKKKLKVLLRSLIKVKSSLKIILFVITVPMLFYLVAYLFSIKVFDGNLSFNWLIALSNIPFWFLAALPFGPMGEELGWRGFMLPKLLEKYSIIKSTFLVGLAWGVWHLASFTFPGAAIPEFLNVSAWTIILYFTNTIALSFVFTYVYFKTNGSVFYAILLHAFFNAASNISLSLFGKTDNFSILLSTYIINIVLVALCGFILIENQKQQV
jgi:CAAX protease family protein